jgi:CelD/BcsL family acetyltransferase involved in cellulose biosynthesis
MDEAFVARVGYSWGDVENVNDVGHLVAVSPFQSRNWLGPWYLTLGRKEGVEPRIISIVERSSGRLLAVWPLVVRKAGRHRVAEFADDEVTDTNAPLLDAAVIADAALFRALWPTMLGALGGVDILHLKGMPATICSDTNALLQTPGATIAHLARNVLRVEGEWSAYHWSLPRHYRKELERSGRVFERDAPNGRFMRAGNCIEAQWILGGAAALQRERITALGLPYVLNAPPYVAFFERLIETGVPDGFLIATALVTGEQDIVAALLGICDGKTFAMIRLAQNHAIWSHCSPGRLVIERTLRALHQQGIKRFDFGIGDYRYKDGFQVHHEPVVEIVVPLSLGGRLTLGVERAGEQVKAITRRTPRLHRALQIAKRRLAR